MKRERCKKGRGREKKKEGGREIGNDKKKKIEGSNKSDCQATVSIKEAGGFQTAEKRVLSPCLVFRLFGHSQF